jgi:hypothetical protein
MIGHRVTSPSSYSDLTRSRTSIALSLFLQIGQRDWLAQFARCKVTRSERLAGLWF